MLCKVAQVFSARGSRPIQVLFASPYSQEGKYVHTLQFFDLLLVLVILVELPYLANISASAASVMCLYNGR